MPKVIRINFLILLVSCAIGVLQSASAQQEIKNANGSDFMTEELPPGPAAGNQASTNRSGTGNLGTNNNSKPSAGTGPQQIKMENGSLFMEELPDKKKRKQAPNPQIDFGSLGVPVDPKGRIIPLIQPGSGPVLSNSSRLEIDYSPRTIYLPYSLQNGPYGYVPSNPFVPYPYNNGYQNQWGAFAVPMGIPWSYTSSSDDPASQQGNFQSAGQYWNSPWFGGGFGTLNESGNGPWNSGGFTPFGGGGYGPWNGAGYGPWSGGMGYPSGIGVSPWGSISPAWSPTASVWSPAWRSPFRASIYAPTITQFQQQGSIRSFFPADMNGSQ